MILLKEIIFYKNNIKENKNYLLSEAYKIKIINNKWIYSNKIKS